MKHRTGLVNYLGTWIMFAGIFFWWSRNSAKKSLANINELKQHLPRQQALSAEGSNSHLKSSKFPWLYSSSNCALNSSYIYKIIIPIVCCNFYFINRLYSINGPCYYNGPYIIIMAKYVTSDIPCRCYWFSNNGPSSKEVHGLYIKRKTLARIFNNICKLDSTLWPWIFPVADLSRDTCFSTV